eukprot:CAMPEP_0168511112 /NCGR_PEP_ID=MMETSP0405-20121227/1911_1 /TAXON_ID=498012 /ORGANISM="Trichosphaerium sp, Strain Am-I-7 wt" /LENGTH=109 /DNA_ID=CAMNT_0008529167 /DNA_START=184 /DNA_END=513 /DNA_ORIENTATION=+
MHTIATSASTNVDGVGKSDAIWIYMNHSCTPNAYVDLSAMEFKCMNKVESGDELTFNYCTTEYTMSCPFTCICGTQSCSGQVQGFKHLNDIQRKEIRYVSEHVAEMAKA